MSHDIKDTEASVAALLDDCWRSLPDGSGEARLITRDQLAEFMEAARLVSLLGACAMDDGGEHG